MKISLDDFGKKLIGVLRERGKDATIKYGGSYVSFDGITRDLTQLHSAYCNLSEESMQEKLENYVIGGFFEDISSTDRLDFQIFKKRIMPRIMPKTIAKDTISKQYVNGTKIVYFLDSERRMVSLTRSNIEDWKIDLEDISKLAINNLWESPETKFWENRINEDVAQLSKQAAGSLILFSRICDGYDSSRLLLPNLRETLAPVLGREFYVAIPYRDILLAFRKDSQSRKGIEEKIRRMYDGSASPITPKLFFVTLDGVAGTE